MAETCLKRRWALASLARRAWFHFLCGKPRHLGWNSISCLTDNIRFAPCQAGTLHRAPQASLSLCLRYQSHQCRSALSSSLLIITGPPPISLFPFLSKPYRHRHTCTTARHWLTFHVPFRSLWSYFWPPHRWKCRPRAPQLTWPLAAFHTRLAHETLPVLWPRNTVSEEYVITPCEAVVSCRKRGPGEH